MKTTMTATAMILAFLCMAGVSSGAGAAEPPSAHNPCFDQPGLWPADVKKTDYYKQKWAPARLLVWAHKTDHEGPWREASNWLEDGKPATKDADETCDLYFLDGKYKVTGGTVDPTVNGGSAWGMWGQLKCRHLTVGNGVELLLRSYDVSGNVWIRSGVNFRVIEGLWNGGANTFARNDMGRWVEFKIPEVNKTDNASVEVLGKWGNADGLYVNSGKLIIGPDSIWAAGDRHQNTIGLKGSLVLMSGATFQTWRNKRYAYDLDNYGELLVGTKERPLVKDAYILMSEKNRKQKGGGFYQEGEDDVGLMMRPQSTMVVTSADPTKARLVFDRWKPWNGSKETEIQGLVQVGLMGKMDLNGVLFNHISLGGIGVKDLSVVNQWKNVVFGKENAGLPKELLNTKMGLRGEQPFFK